ncbi:hypothetical protein Tcan_12211 [Toxocara canis]|uniref:Uncharacterized protein n=1 Tax=Toxocara canis TaxID=6265 RepID=A0A0B2W270_TOXCA|nr:hypothetical protein Tcan_12211 [Toxocara canis]
MPNSPKVPPSCEVSCEQHWWNSAVSRGVLRVDAIAFNLLAFVDAELRLQDDYFTLQKQIFATGRDGFERLLTNLKQNIERVTAISMDQRGGLLNKMLGTEKSSTSSEVFRSSSGKDSSRQWAPPIVIKNNVPTRHTFHSERSNSTT